MAQPPPPKGPRSGPPQTQAQGQRPFVVVQAQGSQGQGHAVMPMRVGAAHPPRSGTAEYQSSAPQPMAGPRQPPLAEARTPYANAPSQNTPALPQRGYARSPAAPATGGPQPGGPGAAVPAPQPPPPSQQRRGAPPASSPSLTPNMASRACAPNAAHQQQRMASVSHRGGQQQQRAQPPVVKGGPTQQQQYRPPPQQDQRAALASRMQQLHAEYRQCMERLKSLPPPSSPSSTSAIESTRMQLQRRLQDLHRQLTSSQTYVAAQPQPQPQPQPQQQPQAQQPQQQQRLPASQPVMSQHGHPPVSTAGTFRSPHSTPQHTLQQQQQQQQPSRYQGQGSGPTTPAPAAAMAGSRRSGPPATTQHAVLAGKPSPGSATSASSGATAALPTSAREALGRIGIIGTPTEDNWFFSLTSSVRRCTREQNMLHVAYQAPCVAPKEKGSAALCECRHFRLPPDTPPNPDIPCPSCGHKLSDHGNTSQLTNTALTYLTVVATVFDYRFKDYRRLYGVVPSDQLSNLSNELQRLWAVLMSCAKRPPPSDIDEQAMDEMSDNLKNGRSPFETPTIRDVVARVVDSLSSQVSSEVLASVRSHVIQRLDNITMKRPEKFAVHRLAHMNMDQYETVHTVWEAYRHGPFKQQPPTSVFGRAFLTTIEIDVFHTFQLLQTYTQSTEHRLALNLFYKELFRLIRPQLPRPLFPISTEGPGAQPSAPADASTVQTPSSTAPTAKQRKARKRRATTKSRGSTSAAAAAASSPSMTAPDAATSAPATTGTATTGSSATGKATGKKRGKSTSASTTAKARVAEGKVVGAASTGRGRGRKGRKRASTQSKGAAAAAAADADDAANETGKDANKTSAAKTEDSATKGSGAGYDDKGVPTNTSSGAADDLLTPHEVALKRAKRVQAVTMGDMLHAAGIATHVPKGEELKRLQEEHRQKQKAAKEARKKADIIGRKSKKPEATPRRLRAADVDKTISPSRLLGLAPKPPRPARDAVKESTWTVVPRVRCADYLQPDAIAEPQHANDHAPTAQGSTTGKDARAKVEIASKSLDVRVLSMLRVHTGVLDTLERETVMKRLLGARNVFCRGLPGMPREYITRIVFDTHHKCLALLRQDNVVGSICFRPFFEERLLEIVFVAVASDEQIKGFGTYLMNHLKDYAVRNGCSHLYTFADDKAVGYFKKQGFSISSSLPPERVGLIKLYKGGVVMECELHPRMTYLDFPSIIKQQREAILRHIDLRKGPQQRFSGKELFQERDFLSPDRIPGLAETGWKADGSHKREQRLNKDEKRFLRGLVQDLRNHEASDPFKEPVRTEDAPDYYTVVQEPMDLQTLGRNVNDNKYTSVEDFLADCSKIFANCEKYNPKGSDVHEAGKRLQKYFQQKIREARATGRLPPA